MDTADIVKFILMAGIMLTVTSVGLRSRPADTLLLLRNPRLDIRAMVSMFVLMPLFVIGLTSALPVMDQAAHAALIALSVSPMPPILPRRQVTVGAGGDYAVGLQVLASLFSIIIAPVFTWLAGRLQGVATVFDAVAMLRVLAVTIGAPLAPASLSPASGRAPPSCPPCLPASSSPCWWRAAPSPWSQRRRTSPGKQGMASSWLSPPSFCSVCLWAICWEAPDAGNRGALALATSARHPGLATTLSAANFPHDREAIIAAVLFFLLANLVLTLPYGLWRRRRALGSKARNTAP